MAIINRQRLLLYFIRKNGKPVRRTQLMKWLFLYAQEEVKPANRFDFLPYKYGPYSFEVDQALAYTLAPYIQEDEAGIGIRTGTEYDVTSIVNKLGPDEHRLVESVWNRFHKLSVDELITDVYNAYPWYASRSELRPSQPAKSAPLAVYTIGYENRSVDAFLNHLLENGVGGIVDVRRNAFSHKYGFSERNLDRLSAKLDIRYTHIPELGIASELRKDLNVNTTLDKLFRDYERDVVQYAEAISDAASAMQRVPTALLCFEADPDCCHRGRLAPIISRHTGYRIVHL